MWTNAFIERGICGIHVGAGKIPSQYFGFSVSLNIQPVLLPDISFVYHRKYVTLVTESVDK
jgi:hypothetical protein